MNITKEELDEKVNAIIKFKMDQLLEAVRNTAKANWLVAFHSCSQKHAYYWAAFEQMEEMLQKELIMALPFDDIIADKKRKKKNEVVEKMSNQFLQRGSRDFDYHLRYIVSMVEDAQDYLK